MTGQQSAGDVQTGAAVQVHNGSGESVTATVKGVNLEEPASSGNWDLLIAPDDVLDPVPDLLITAVDFVEHR